MPILIKLFSIWKIPNSVKRILSRIHNYIVSAPSADIDYSSENNAIPGSTFKGCNCNKFTINTSLKITSTVCEYLSPIGMSFHGCKCIPFDKSMPPCLSLVWHKIYNHILCKGCLLLAVPVLLDFIVYPHHITTSIVAFHHGSVLNSYTVITFCMNQISTDLISYLLSYFDFFTQLFAVSGSIHLDITANILFLVLTNAVSPKYSQP